MSIGVRRLPALVLLACLVAMSLPFFAHAVGTMADGMCNPVTPVCGCGQVMGSHGCTGGVNKFMCKCFDFTAGHTTNGICVATNKCLDSSDAGGLTSLGSILGQLLGKLMQPSPSSGSSAATTPTTPTLTGCTTGQYFQTSDVTQLSNPCAQYVPTTPVITGTSTGGTGGCDTLSQLLGTCGTSSTCPTTAVSCSQGFNEVPQTGFDANGCQLPDQCVLSTTGGTQTGGSGVTSVVAATGTSSGVNLSGLGSPSTLVPGLTNGTGGDILFSGNGATIFSNSQNLANNTGVAGFFGSDTFSGGQPQGIAAQICQARPWAAGFLNSVLPVAFFDGLCTARGYQVGTPPTPVPATPVVQLQQTKPAPKPVTPAPAATSTPTIPPQVSIWAVPASVPLNTRTSIFWNTQGVTSCTESSPDGSFNQSSLSGGSATVPIVGATTFTISCIDTAGNPVTGYVTVNLSI